MFLIMHSNNFWEISQIFQFPSDLNQYSAAQKKWGKGVVREFRDHLSDNPKLIARYKNMIPR